MNELPSDTNEKVKEIQQAIADTQARLKAIMPLEEIEKMLASLRAEEAALLATIADISVDTAVIAQQFWHDVPNFDDSDLLTATNSYLAYLASRFRYLDFRGIGFVDQLPHRLGLLNMFVPLKVRPYLPEGETWPRHFEDAAQNHDPVSILPLLSQEEGLLILGDLGAGKTTLLKYLALALATGKEVVEGIDGRIPLILPLSAYADQLRESAIPLQDFFETYFNSLGIPLPLDKMFREILAIGKGLFLLDGLDEVRDLALRHQVVEQILNFFAFHKQAGNKMIVASRLIGYREARLISDGLVECTIADLDQDGISLFVDRWLLLVEGESFTNDQVAEDKAALLIQIQENDALARLASNPLLLTIMILMRRQGLSLPQRRVELYDQFLRTLIRDWNLARNPQRSPTSSVTDIIETLHILGPLALWMEEQNPGVGLVQREDLRRELEAICRFRGYEQPNKTAHQFLQDIKQYSGVLVEREDGNVAFLHRSFQEYLAAWAVAQRGQSDLTPVVAFIDAHLYDISWWELLRLTVGILGIVQQREEAAGIVLNRLLTSEMGDGGIALALGGAILGDIWPGGVPTAVYDDVVRHLFQAVRDIHEIKADWRIAIGRALGRLSEGETIVNEMHFCYVPGGPFYLGERHFEQLISDLDAPFWVSQYPISNGQFAEFVNDGGYKVAEFWHEAAAVNRWRMGEVMDWERLGWRKKPHNYGYPFNLANHPVVGISFFEALAFIRWLEKRWRAAGFIEPDWQVRLPSELEWEKAARGGLQLPELPVQADVPILISVYDSFFERLVENPHPKRPFPWGNEPSTNHANFREKNSKLFDESTNLGFCFPKGRSPLGCCDMSGNVWEWTRSLLRPYPYDAEDGRESEAVQLYHTIALRGGAFWSSEDQIQTVSRIGRSPNTRSDSIGFRICVVVPIPPR